MARYSKPGVFTLLVFCFGTAYWTPGFPFFGGGPGTGMLLGILKAVQAKQSGMQAVQNEIQAVINAVQATVDEIERLADLDHRLLRSGQGFLSLRSRMREIFEGLRTVVQYGDAVAYNNVDLIKKFKEVHPNWETYMAGSDYDALVSRYKRWVTSTHDSILGALRAAKLQAKHFRDEDRMMVQIERKLKTASGTNQLLQLGSSIGNIQVDQLQKLRQLQMAQIQLQSAQASNQIDRQAESDAGFTRAKAPVEFTKSKEFTGLRLDGSLR